MPRLLHSIAVQERTISADGVEVFDLPVNPLSVVLLHLKPLNDTGTLSNFQRIMGICGMLNRITIAHRGASVFSMSGRDAVALNFLRHGILPREANSDSTDNERRSVILPVFLGKQAYDVKSCFPASKRGELVMELDIDIADTGYDNTRIAVETIELLDARPSEFERKTTIARTFAATGDQEIELPLGNVIRGLLLFGTTPFAGAAPAPSWGRIGLALDNQEHSVADSDFEAMMATNCLLGGGTPWPDAHTHFVPTNAGAFEETTAPAEYGFDGYENYGFVNLDPTGDDAFSIDTKGASSFRIKANAETADAVRVVTVERMSASNLV